MMNYEKLIASRQYIVSDLIIKQAVKLKLELSEFLLLVYFHNLDEKVFDLVKIKKNLFLSEKEILEAFNNLTTKNLINIEVKKDDYGHINEAVSLESFYKLICEGLQKDDEENAKENIFDIFEREFNRKLTPMEYEIVNAWLDNSTSEEIILGALKEAIYNGVKSFRYIDKIIYEWSKKGFKTMNDVKNHINNQYQEKNKKEEVELFDYDWLDGND